MMSEGDRTIEEQARRIEKLESALRELMKAFRAAFDSSSGFSPDSEPEMVAAREALDEE